MASRKSVVSKSDGTKGGFNYQREVKQLKKDQQLSLQDKEYLHLEANLKLQADKCAQLEQHNEELRAEAAKNLKSATVAAKRQQAAEQNNLQLLTQINQLAHTLSSLKNVNMALNSQMTTMAMQPMQPMPPIQPAQPIVAQMVTQS